NTDRQYLSSYTVFVVIVAEKGAPSFGRYVSISTPRHSAITVPSPPLRRSDVQIEAQLGLRGGDPDLVGTWRRSNRRSAILLVMGKTRPLPRPCQQPQGATCSRCA